MQKNQTLLKKKKNFAYIEALFSKHINKFYNVFV